MTPSPAAIALIKQFEGCVLHAYADPGTHGEPYTIGWGSTGPDIHLGMTWTQEQADQRLAADLVRFGAGVAHVVGSATQHQFDAMCVFAYNVGLHALEESTLLRKHRDGDFAGVANEFLKWTHSSGRVLPGLVRRREAERELYLS